MATLLVVLGAIPSIIKFWNQILSLIKILQGTPEEHHQVVMENIAIEAARLKETGRPKWD